MLQIRSISTCLPLAIYLFLSGIYRKSVKKGARRPVHATFCHCITTLEFSAYRIFSTTHQPHVVRILIYNRSVARRLQITYLIFEKNDISIRFISHYFSFRTCPIMGGEYPVIFCGILNFWETYQQEYRTRHATQLVAGVCSDIQ